MDLERNVGLLERNARRVVFEDVDFVRVLGQDSAVRCLGLDLIDQALVRLSSVVYLPPSDFKGIYREGAVLVLSLFEWTEGSVTTKNALAGGESNVILKRSRWCPR